MLKGITITGADDGVSALHLVGLAEEFPFVEWGVLASIDRSGEPRYPSAEWVQYFARTAQMMRVRTSMHLCGFYSKRAVLGDTEFLKQIRAWGFKRAQINGWTPGGRLVASAAEFPGLELILQARDVPAVEEASVHALAIRANGGERGIKLSEYPTGIGSVVVGYAGGLVPGAVGLTVDLLLKQGRTFWLDIESGVRTDDRFDPDKVRSVLTEVAAVFAQHGAKP